MAIDNSRRSLSKAISWRVFAVTTLFVVSYFVLKGNSTQALWVTLIYHGIQLITYFMHERLWAMIRWGKSKGLFIQFTGMSGAGKSTLAQDVARKLRRQGYQIEIIDGDEYREGLCSDLSFSKKDRNTNIKRLGFVSKILARNGVISIIAAINPYDNIRQELNQLGPNVKTVYIKCNIETLKKRDTKGLYRKALLPPDDPAHIPNFTGISDPFEEPTHPDLTIDTDTQTVESSSAMLERFIKQSI